MKIERLHDKLYLKSNRYNNPKESTKMSLMKRIRSKKNVVDSVKFQKFDDSESL